MQSNKTVVLGEASESDSEEISLKDDEIQVDARDEELDNFHDSIRAAGANQAAGRNDANARAQHEPTNNRRGFGASWFPFAEASSSLAKLVTYNPYSLLAATMQGSSHPKAPAQVLDPRQEAVNNLSLLHRNLYIKNQQLYACLDHAFKHPYIKASRDLNTISQRLVGVQRTIQEVEIGVANIKREQINLDLQIHLIK